MGIYVGTSGWAYSSWKPDFYPAKLPSKKFLEYYGTQLNSVEVNYTFRQLPSGAMLEGWLAATSPRFALSFKAPQRITHFARLKDCGQLLDAFYKSLAPVQSAKRLGILLFQLPPNFKANAGLLEAFLVSATRKDLRLAFEFRHDSWFDESIFRMLEKHQAALCVAESDELESPDIVTANFRCYRLRKSSYSPADVSRVAAVMNERSKAGNVFAYFKHEETPTGAINAASVLQQLGAD
jgi:uncharacterized protein YecE (DUF72 family)